VPRAWVVRDATMHRGQFFIGLTVMLGLDDLEPGEAGKMFPINTARMSPGSGAGDSASQSVLAKSKYNHEDRGLPIVLVLQ